MIRRLEMTHPVFGFGSVEAQSQLPSIQGKGGVFFCGAWAGYGFHEDGLKSAVDVVTQHLGVDLPWVPRTTNPKIGIWDSQMLAVFDRFAGGAIRTGRLRLLLPNGEERHYGRPLQLQHPGLPDPEAWRGKPR